MSAEQNAIEIIKQISKQISPLTKKKISKLQFNKKDNEWLSYLSQNSPHWEDLTCRVKFPDESGESEIHVGFYSAESTGNLQNVIETIDSQFNTKSDSVDKNENRIRLIWKVNLNDSSTIEKALEAIKPIIFDFTSLALQVLFGGKAAIFSTTIISKKENITESVTPTETVNNDSHKNHIQTYTWDDGDHYEGFWKGEYPHGEGKMNYFNGDVYEGEWKDGQRHGIGKMTYKVDVLGADTYEGEWENNLRHGHGKMIYKDALGGADTYEGEWENDWRHGHGKMTYKDDVLGADTYEGEWKDNERHFGKMTYVNCDVYEGVWSLIGLRDGNGKMTSANGDVYEGEWKDGCRHGHGKQTWPNGKWKQGIWEDDKLISGKVKLIFDSGGQYEGEWENGNYHGKGIYVWPSGKKYEGEWKDGCRHGHGKQTWPNGDCYDGDWSEGLRHGYGQMKYANNDFYFGNWIKDMRHGEAISLINGEAIKLWENDKPKIEIIWDTYTWDNGNHYEGYWKGNYPHGEGKKTFANGGWKKGEFKEGEFISGEGKVIYEDGDYYEGELKGGQRHGHGEYHLNTGGVWSGNYYEDLRHGRMWFDSDGDGLGYYIEYVFGERKYKEGSVVQLKSGGPKMTVTNVSYTTLTCEWINRGKPHSKEFEEDQLKLIE